MKKFWYAIGTIVLSIIASVIYDIIKSQPFLTGIANFFAWAGKLVYIFFILKIQIWILSIILILIVIIRKIYFNIRPPKPTYRQDVFREWIWKWDYKFNTQKKGWVIINLQSYCPDCDIKLVNSNFGSPIQSSHYTERCPNCGTTYRKVGTPPVENEQEIKVLIENNINKSTTSNKK